MPISLLNEDITKIHKEIISHHYHNLISNAKYESGMSTCLLLRPVKKLDRGIIRTDRVAKNPRGPYSKDLFSMTGGRPQVSTSKKLLMQLKLPVDTYFQKTLQASHVVLLYHGKNLPLHHRKYHQASHLCGNKACINVKHLVWERFDLNVSRDLCLVYKETCEHNPQCIPQHTQ